MILHKPSILCSELELRPSTKTEAHNSVSQQSETNSDYHNPMWKLITHHKPQQPTDTLTSMYVWEATATRITVVWGPEKCSEVPNKIFKCQQKILNSSKMLKNSRNK